jgi:LPXTG-site transpeptidase (sortase) family protein
MTPDLTTRPACRTRRGLARFIAGLALVAVTAACGSSDQNDVAPAGSKPAVTASPAPVTTASQEVTEAPPEPAAIQSEATPMGTGGIEGPYTLHIPRIAVDARVVPIQSNAERILEPPQDPSVAGWWSEGAAPGEPQGSAVVVGHTVRSRDGGVFDDVRDLSVGDAIQVKGSDSTLTYRVQSIDVLSKKEVARDAEEIFAQTGAGRLVLITCDDWDGAAWRSNIITIAAPA